MQTPDLSFLPREASGLTLTGWDGFSYVAADGRTFASIDGEPSAADCDASLASPPPRILSAAEAIDQAQRTLDAWAQAWGYDHVARACTYVGDPYPRFNAEGTALRDARSAVWAYLDAHQEDAATAEELAAILETFKPARPSAPYA